MSTIFYYDHRLLGASSSRQRMPGAEATCLHGMRSRPTFFPLICGTRSKMINKTFIFNSFPVPLTWWDKRGTKAGQNKQIFQLRNLSPLEPAAYDLTKIHS
jgi:hypothetical protein